MIIGERDADSIDEIGRVDLGPTTAMIEIRDGKSSCLKFCLNFSRRGKPFRGGFARVSSNYMRDV